MTDLKPCPHCGSPMKTMRDILFNKVTILHDYNDSRQTTCPFKVTANFKDEATAAAAWNTRTPQWNPDIRNDSLDEAARYHDLRVDALMEELKSDHFKDDEMVHLQSILNKHKHYAKGIRALKADTT